jgi:TatD DNase family protein
MFKVVDTHAHIHMPQFEVDRDLIIQNFEKDDIEFIVEIGVDLESSRKAVKLSYDNHRIFSAVGVHPHDVKEINEDTLEEIENLARFSKVVAIGEIGLDYYRNLSPRELQVKYFIEQIKLAKKLDKPLIVHIRDAYDEALKILKEHARGMKVVIHSFSGSMDDVQTAISLGFYIGISGPVTFKKADTLRENVKMIPLNRILSETDCPYLTPEPFRGKRNEPKYVKYIVEKIAQIKEKNVELVANQILENSREFFNIKY